MGPWSHGQWNRDDGDRLGHAFWDQKTAVWFRDSVQFPFFMHHLKGTRDPGLPEALVFETGANRWRHYDAWPPRDAARTVLYLRPGGALAFTPPAERDGPSLKENS